MTQGVPRPLAPLPCTSPLFLRLKFHRPLGLCAGCAGRLREENYSNHLVTHQLWGAHPTPSPRTHSLRPTASQLARVPNKATGGEGGPQHRCETPGLAEQHCLQQPPTPPPRHRRCGESGNAPKSPTGSRQSSDKPWLVPGVMSWAYGVLHRWGPGPAALPNPS